MARVPFCAGEVKTGGTCRGAFKRPSPHKLQTIYAAYNVIKRQAMLPRWQLAVESAESALHY
ncbi:MAG: hypothetical protein CL810_06405 [Cobetia sp.]|nr:hypothetical protein [Cobetia sp.]MBK09181.1 hypothetical protein [Cobetia sp.]HBJ27075.1 hypothetical protein [Cobetia sp.]